LSVFGSFSIGYWEMRGEIKLCAGKANPRLADGISKYLGIPLAGIDISHFKDGETFVRVKENVRGRSVFLIQPTTPPVNNNLMELLIIMDALKRASADRIIVVTPYYGYSRQDRKAEPRVPITARLVANLIEAAGATRVVTVDLHAGQIQGFFNIPVDNLYASPILIESIRKKNFSRPVVVSPDAGGVARARAFARHLNADLAIIDKRRTGHNVAEVMNIIGDVDGREAILIDDMIDSAGTIQEASRALKKAGAVRIMACATHGVLSEPALERIANSELEEVLITDTVPLKDADSSLMEKIKVVSIASLLGEAIKRIHEGTSISELFA